MLVSHGGTAWLSSADENATLKSSEQDANENRARHQSTHTRNHRKEGPPLSTACTERRGGKRTAETHQLELHVFDLGKLGGVKEKEEKKYMCNS